MTVNLKLLTVQIAGMFVVFALSLFLAAGAVIWPAGWVFLILFFGFTVTLSRWLLRHNPGLLTERIMGIGKPDQKTWDKVFYLVANVYFLAWLVLMPLDAVRFRWAPMPGWLQVVCAPSNVCDRYHLHGRHNSLAGIMVWVIVGADHRRRDSVSSGAGGTHAASGAARI